MRRFSAARQSSEILFTWALSILLWLATADRALAHIVVDPTAGFAGGFSHPLSGPDHFLAMFAVGLWGAQMGGRSVWTLPVVFPLIMTLGGIAGMLGLPMPSVEVGIAISVLVLGLAIALAWRPVEIIPPLIVAVFAIFHGYAHGAELPVAADPAAYATGFVLATGLIHVSGILVGLILARPLHGRIARALGGLIALGGVYYLVA